MISDTGNGHFEQLAHIMGVRQVGLGADTMLMGGFPYVIEAVGAPRSVTESLRAAAHRGTVLLLGAAGMSEVDLTPVWYKEAALVGSIDHSVDAGSAPGLAGRSGSPLGRSCARRTWQPGFLPDEVVVTHEFALEDYRQAIETAIDRENSATPLRSSSVPVEKPETGHRPAPLSPGEAAQATFILLIPFLDLAYRTVRFNAFMARFLRTEAWPKETR